MVPRGGEEIAVIQTTQAGRNPSKLETVRMVFAHLQPAPAPPEVLQELLLGDVASTESDRHLGHGEGLIESTVMRAALDCVPGAHPSSRNLSRTSIR